ncbi:MAG: glycoside hydrolase family 127 protein [Bacteroidales bacterium]|nr:glycoside hydrolase family 127 protein [Bacteroidales bacterium]
MNAIAKTIASLLLILVATSQHEINAQLKSSENAPFTKYSKLKITDIHPQGWIKEFLERQKSGLTGNIEVAGYPFNTGLWACEKMKGSQEAWWPYEQTAYYIDGVHRLGELLNDKNLIAKAEANTNYVKLHLDSTGRFGTHLSDRWWRWPYANFNRNFMLDYELTHDYSIVEMLQKHYLTFSAKDFADDLELANVEELCWLYGITKDKRMLDMAEEAYRLFKSDVNNRNRAGCDIQFGSDMKPNHHVVVYLELVKIPAILYSYTGKTEYKQEAINGIKQAEKYNMLISGLPSSTEHFAGISELSGTETCNTAVFPYTYGYFLRITGDASLGDKIEKEVFNAGIGSVTKDFKSHQYFSAPNQVIATLNSNNYGHNPGRMAYLPGHDVECCTGNVNRFMPYYVEQMWLRDNQNGVVAALFGPSSVNLSVGAKQEPITITETTDYPFSDKIEFQFQMKKAVNFSFSIRIPAWSNNSQISINGKPINDKIMPGTFYKLERQFSDKDIVTLTLPMDIRVSNWPNNGVGVERGPLVYSLAINSKDSIVKDYERATTQFPAIDRRPASDWNYALNLSEGEKSPFQIIENKKPGYFWDNGNAPITIRIPAKKVTNWVMKEVIDPKTGVKFLTTPEFPNELKTENKTEYIDLVPYGSTLLRVSVFPEYKSKDVVGSLQKFPDFKSKHVDPRNVEVWLPESYATSPDKHYPVLYMHDGQVIFQRGRGFSGEEWEVDEMMTKLIKENKIKEAIVVGIWNTPKRFREYQPNKPFENLNGENQKIRQQLDAEYFGVPLADNYLKLIVEELKPFIDRSFRTLPDKQNTYMMGSSMGGLITIYAKTCYPDVFGAVACLSTHFSVSLKQNNPRIPTIIINYLSKHLPEGNDDNRIYFDFGTETLDAWYAPYQKQMDKVMEARGYKQGENWVTRNFVGAEHSEVAWRKRLDIPLLFLLGK